MNKVRLLVEMDVKPDLVSDFCKMFRTEFITRSRGEQGCEFYDLWQDPESPEKMTIVEIWSSRADLDRHLAQDWFDEWAAKMEAMQNTPLVVRELALPKG